MSTFLGIAFIVGLLVFATLQIIKIVQVVKAKKKLKSSLKGDKKE